MRVSHWLLTALACGACVLPEVTAEKGAQLPEQSQPERVRETSPAPESGSDPGGKPVSELSVGVAGRSEAGSVAQPASPPGSGGSGVAGNPAQQCDPMSPPHCESELLLVSCDAQGRKTIQSCPAVENAESACIDARCTGRCADGFIACDGTTELCERSRWDFDAPVTDGWWTSGTATNPARLSPRGQKARSGLMALGAAVDVKQAATSVNVNWDVCPHVGLRLQSTGISLWTFIDAGSSADATRLSQCRITATIAGTRMVAGPVTAVSFGAWTKVSATLSAAEPATGVSLECQLWRGTEDWQGTLWVDDLLVQ